jgi:hypothetical protein
MSTTAIYILQLEHGKYYVGESKDPVKAMEEHREGLGPFWTKIHKPVRIEAVMPFKSAGEVDLYTKTAMRKYGIENVRGGSFQDARLKDADRHRLHSEFQDQSNCLIA